jgi:hypothetical protein
MENSQEMQTKKAECDMQMLQDPSAQFRIMTKLEVKEGKKVRLARFLRDIHLEDHTNAIPEEGTISVQEGTDLRNLSSEKAQNLIEALHNGAKLDKGSLIRIGKAAACPQARLHACRSPWGRQGNCRWRPAWQS